MELTFEYWIAKLADHMVGAMTFDLGRYLIAASLISVILWLAKGWADARRIQNRRAGRSDYIRELSSSMRTVVVFALTTITTVVFLETGVIHFVDSGYSWGAFALQLAAMIVAHDAYFYWMHRALHHRKLFRATHLHHHKSRTPTPWAAYSFSSIEAFTEAAFVPAYLLLVSLAGFSNIGFAIFIFLAHMIMRNVMGHSGVELMPAGWVHSKWLDWITTTTHHDLHHSEVKYNFGLYFTWWDRIMGTEHPQYKARFDAVAKPFLLSRRTAEVISVAAMIGLAGYVGMLASTGSLSAI
jgi:sterol desaturase/sphingolipid hydroxylase (fatty acid hydroxylase superfamily)